MRYHNLNFYNILFLFIVFQVNFSTLAQNIWVDVSDETIISSSNRYIIPSAYKTYSIDIDALSKILVNAPKEFSVSVPDSPLIIQLPMPNGQMQSFSIVKSSIMHPVLQSKFPLINSYLGQGIDDRTSSLRISIDHNGFHAMIISSSETVYIDPYSLNNTEYCISYYKKDFYLNNTKIRTGQCLLDTSFTSPSLSKIAAGQSGDVLRTYRAAIAVTGEYTSFHGGSVDDAMAAINTTLNRINGVYEREASFRLILVENNDLLVYTNSSSDPYSNGNTGAMLDENQVNVDDVIGTDNYDIGHVYGTDSGGLAGLGVVCNNSRKAEGVTGNGAPIGDPFDIDYVCHEMGHQFGGNHTQNNSCNRSNSAAFEPGSASTIMGYAGICPPNLQNNSNDYYHTHSFDEITQHANGDGSAIDCAEQIESGNNIPVANAGESGFYIPANTPFELIGSGNDIDASDMLTYCWEQFDLGPVTDDSDNDLTAPSGSQPIFRSFSPSTSSTRVFPRMQDLLSGTNTIGEILPTYARDLTFRLTVRDNRAGSGGVSYDQMSFEVVDNDGFSVNNISENWEYGNTYNVSWNPNETNEEPVNCSTLDIYLSVDGGDFDLLIAEGVSNEIASTDIICPNITSNNARIKIKASDNIFFNISNSFQIDQPSEPNFSMTISPDLLNLCSSPGQSAIFDVVIDPILNYDQDVTLSIFGVPDGVLVDFNPAIVAPGNNSTLTISSPLAIPSVLSPISFVVTAISDDIVHETNAEITVVEGVPLPPEQIYPPDGIDGVTLTPTFTWTSVDNATSYKLTISSDADFTQILYEFDNILVEEYALGVFLNPETSYFWNIMAQNPCGDSENSSIFSFISGLESITENSGCMDETAYNYDVLATVDDGSCEPFIFGCTNELADNFDETSNSDNGSCILSGCTNSDAENFNEFANNDDGSCIINGCTDPLSFNFNPDANSEDGTCVATNFGCTDTEANNFNPNVNLDDGSCDYTSLVIIDYEELSGSNFHFFAYINDIPSVTFLLWNMGDGNIYQSEYEPTHYYQENGTYQVSVNVYSTTGAFIAYTNIEVTNVSIGCTDENAVNFDITATADDGSCIDPIYGCTDPNAINYDENANYDDDSCEGVVNGCTDSLAMNFNPQANIDNQSCEYELLGCTDSEALNFNPLANLDDASCIFALPTEPNWSINFTSNNHTVLVPNTASILINDGPIQLGDYIGVFYLGLDDELHCAGKIMWTGITNTITVYGSDPNEFNGMAPGEVFTWMTWNSLNNEYRSAIVDYDTSMPNTDSFEADGISAILSLSNVSEQIIDLTEGWNLISSHISPDFPSIGDVLAPVVDDLFLAKDEFGQVFWPQYNLNNIGDHVVGKAYKLKMNQENTLQIRGAQVDPLDYTLTLFEGWSYLGYLRESPADASSVLESIQEDILLIKDGIGNVYFPEFNVNTIGNMVPGQGYQIRMTNNTEFVYPSNELVLPQLRLSSSNVMNHYPTPLFREMNMNVVLPHISLSMIANKGDEFIVKDALGQVISSAVYQDQTLVMALWIDKENIGAKFEIYHWSKEENSEKLLDIIWREGNTILNSNAVNIASDITFFDTLTQNLKVFPNPMNERSKIHFYIDKSQKVSLVLYNSLGVKVSNLLDSTLPKGAHNAILESMNLKSGMYFLKLITDQEITVKRVNISK